MPKPLAPEEISELCKAAYAAGLEDASLSLTAEAEVARQYNIIGGFGACLLTAWLSFFYGRSSGTASAEAAASVLSAMQQTQMDTIAKELATTLEDNQALTRVRVEQAELLSQQRKEMDKAAHQMRVMRQSVRKMAIRNGIMQRRVASLKTSVLLVQKQLYYSVAGVGVLSLLMLWSMRRRRLDDRRAAESIATAVELPKRTSEA